MISFKEIIFSEQKLEGEYDKVCKLTSVFDIMKLATIIKINFDEAQQLIIKACKSFGVANHPEVNQARGRQEYQKFGKIFLRQPTTVHATLHELAHYLVLGKNDPPKKIVSKKLLKLYYNVESLEDLNDEDRKEALIYATKFRFEPHGQSFVSKLDELLKWWKEYECKYKLSEQKEISSYKTFYHGTTKENAENILKNGVDIDAIRIHDAGDFGWGFYVTPKLSLAKAYGRGAILELKIDTSKFAYIENPYFLDEFEERKPQTYEEELFYDIVFSSGEMSTVKSARNRKNVAKKVGQVFLKNGYKGIETNVDGGEAVIFDSSCIKSIGLHKELREQIVKESLVEMVMPREIDKSKVYYHGTKDKNSALKIAKEGLRPQDIEFLEKKYVIPDNDEAGQEVDKQYMSISGRVYLTQDLFSAIQYASPGSGFELKGNQAKGCVVVINGNKIEDIEPDEDDVGSIILNIGNYVRSPRQYPLSFKIRAKYLIELHKIAIKYLGEKYWEKFFNEPQVGKIILPHLSDELKHVIIDIGGKIAHVGPIGVDEVWEFDIKDYYNLYSQDKKSRKSIIDEFANNFFSKYARRIK